MAVVMAKPSINLKKIATILRDYITANHINENGQSDLRIVKQKLTFGHMNIPYVGHISIFYNL
ncbi:hypothetical protein DSUL_60290 [Desulfovibrionales bacterium]